MLVKFVYFVILPLFQVIVKISASDGDRSPFYQKCVNNCMKANCTNDGLTFNEKVHNKLEIYIHILQWSCKDECRYHCMWRTVQGFRDRGFETPKFHGKWPFLRIMGVQEPASAFSSLLNLAANVYMYLEIKNNFPIKKHPLVLLWHVFAWVCINAWMWSTIFHTRDTPFTEFMDYTCALSMVMALFIASIVRIFHHRRKLVACIVIPTMGYFMLHARYLYSGDIDYDYNMLVNIIFGAVGSVLWLAWSVAQSLSGRPAWRLASFTLLSGAALTLELLDFPPRRGWDAHALWHLSTAPLPVLFYGFVIDDLHFLTASTTKKMYLKTT